MKKRTPGQVAAEIAIVPESPALTAITEFKYKGNLPDSIDPVDLMEAILAQSSQIQGGDLSLIERHLYAQAVGLNAIFSKCMVEMATSKPLGVVQTYGTLALKAQNQSRMALEALVQLKNPSKTMVIKQQNNAINQQINQTANPANELLKDTNHEALEQRGKGEAIELNSLMETVDAVYRAQDE